MTIVMNYCYVFIFLLIAKEVSGFYYKIDEGYRGLVSYSGAYVEELLMPGQSGFTRPNIWPHYVNIDYIEIRPQEDSAKKVQCGSKDGSIHWIDSIEIGNTLHPDSVYDTVKKYGIDYDQKLIMNKVRHQTNVVCSKLDTYDIFVTKFDQLDDMLLKFLQDEQDRLKTGVTIDYVRLTKPKLPKDQADTYEGISKQQIQQKLEEERSKTNKLIAANSKAETQAKVDRDIIDADGKLQVTKKEAEAHLATEKAKTDAETYRMSQEAKANQELLTEAYLQYIQIQAIANNSKVYFGEMPTTVWSTRDFGIGVAQ